LSNSSDILAAANKNTFGFFETLFGDYKNDIFYMLCRLARDLKEIAQRWPESSVKPLRV
jgi:hypothetical protein